MAKNTIQNFNRPDLSQSFLRVEGARGFYPAILGTDSHFFATFLSLHLCPQHHHYDSNWSLGFCLTVSSKAKANFPQTKLCLQRETLPTINQTEQIRIWPKRSKSSSGVYKGRWNFAPNWSEEDFAMVRFVYTVYTIQPTCISTKERKKVSSKVHLQVLTNSKARNDFLLHILPW